MHVLRDGQGRLVGRARSAAAAHRASRTRDRLGCSVCNHAGGEAGHLHLSRGDVVLVVGERSPIAAVRQAHRELPPFESGSQEQAEATEMWRLAGLAPDERSGSEARSRWSEGRLVDRPFRAPHHTVSEAGLVGKVDQLGGERRERVGRRWVTKSEPVSYRVRPGEVSLATGGVLLLDEVLEFRGSTLDVLAVALRDGHAVHVRGYATGDPQTFRLPARPYAVVTPEQLAKYGSNARYAGIMGLVTREVRL